MLAFVYGTLKSGQCRGHVLSKSTFLGKAETVEKYRLFHVPGGNYPALCKDGEHNIKGELYDIDPSLLPTLDGIEGVAFGLYSRQVVPVKNAAGETVEATTYFYERSTKNLVLCEDVWPVK